MKTSDDVPIELLEKFKILLSPIIFRGCKTREEVAKYFIETVMNIIVRIVDSIIVVNYRYS